MRTIACLFFSLFVARELAAAPLLLTQHGLLSQGGSYSGSDCHTGWNEQLWNLEAEEVY